jgi:hypothetical protein
LVDAQQILTLTIVAAAAGYLVRRTWRHVSGRRIGGCGACAGCEATPGKEGPAAKPLIPLETLTASANKHERRDGRQSC